MKQPLAYVHPAAKIASNVVIDPFVTIDQNVEIGEGTRIGSNVTILEGARQKLYHLLWCCYFGRSSRPQIPWRRLRGYYR